jgi:hypothetical protein
MFIVTTGDLKGTCYEGAIVAVWWWIYNYLCNQYLSTLTLRVRIPQREDVLDTTLCENVCQWLAAGQWFTPSTPVSFTSKTDRQDKTEILLKVALALTLL